MDMISHGFFFCNGDRIPSWNGAERYPGSFKIVAVTPGVIVASEEKVDQPASAMRPVLLWSVVLVCEHAL